MSKRVLVPIATGSEELEAISIVNALRRVGTDVVIASIEDDKIVTCSRKTKIVADALLKDVSDQTFDAIVLPGGMPGAERLRDCELLKEMLLTHYKNSNSYVAAICASPAVVLAKHGLLDNHEATAYPCFLDDLPKPEKTSKVVVSGKVVTSRGPGTSLDFAIKLVELMYGKDKAEHLAKEMLHGQ